jgi:hypothetical protein
MYASSSSSPPQQTIDVNAEAIAVLNASSTYDNQSIQLHGLLTQARDLENQINEHLSPHISRATRSLGTQLLKSVQMHQKTLRNLSQNLEPLQKEAQKALKDLGKIQGKLSKLKPKKTTEIEKETRKAQQISTQITQRLERSQSNQTPIARGGIAAGIHVVTQALNYSENQVRELGW